MTEVGFDLRIEFNLTIKGNALMPVTLSQMLLRLEYTMSMTFTNFVEIGFLELIQVWFCGARQETGEKLDRIPVNEFPRGSWLAG